MSRTLSTAEAARITGLPEAHVRELARSGLCRPGRRGRRYAFSFQDLVVLRAARGLLEAGVTPRRARRALADLAGALPEGRSLSGVRVYAEGRRVAVRDERGVWEPETGQAMIDFDVGSLAEATQAPGTRGGPCDSGEAFERALALEESDPKAAADAYREVLRERPEHIDAHVNLGRLCHEAGDLAEAEALYRAALVHASEDPVVHFNLALVLEDARRPDEARRCYQRALSLDAEFSDAHWNLASLCEELGLAADALRHYRAYQKLTER